MEELEFLALLAALLGLLLGLGCAFLLAVYDQTGPGFFFVPLEAG